MVCVWSVIHQIRPLTELDTVQMAARSYSHKPSLTSNDAVRIGQLSIRTWIIKVKVRTKVKSEGNLKICGLPVRLITCISVSSESAGTVGNNLIDSKLRSTDILMLYKR